MTFTVQQLINQSDLDSALNQMVSWFPEYADEINQNRQKVIDAILAEPSLNSISGVKELSSFRTDQFDMDIRDLSSDKCQQALVKFCFYAIAFMFSLLGLELKFEKKIEEIIWKYLRNSNLDQLVKKIKAYYETSIVKKPLNMAKRLLDVLEELITLGVMKAVIIAIKDGMSVFQWIKLIATATVLVSKWISTAGLAFIITAATVIMSAIELNEYAKNVVNDCTNTHCSLTSLQPYLNL
jgi:hypothetical protein